MDRRVALFAVVAVVVFAAGAGAFAYRAFAPGASTVQVSIVDYSFRPAILTIRAGTEVRWVNMDLVAHTVSFSEHGNITGGVESGLLGHMGTFRYTFDTPGTYAYHCDPHPSMTGTVTVTA